MRLVSSLLALLFLAAWVNPVGAESLRPYALRGLGTLHADTDHVIARGINAAGGVVGDARTGRGHFAFVWHHQGGMHEVTGPGSAHPYATGADLGDDYAVVGASGFDLASAPAHAFFWQPGGKVLRLDEGVAGNFDTSRAIALAGDGSVVGVYSGRDGDRAFIWRPEEGLAPVLPQSDAVSGSRAESINDAGTVAGTARRNGHATAFRRPPGGAKPQWLTLPGSREDTASHALALSADGDVAGRLHGAGTRATAFLWEASGEFRLLGHLDPEIGFSEASAVAGDVVVGRSLTAEGMRAFIWDEAHGMRRLEGLVGVPDGVEAPQLLGAVGINDRGQIAAVGRPAGGDRIRSYRLDPR